MKNLGKLALALTLVATTSSFVLADGMIFEPTEVGASSKSEIKVLSKADKTPTVDNSYSADAVGNKSFESAVVQLDNGQVEIRNRLMVLKDDYTNVDAKYVDYKQQRADLKKQIKKEESRIKKIESAKKTIKKQMEEINKATK